MLEDGLRKSLPWARRRRRDAVGVEVVAARDRDDARLREAAHTLRTPIAVAQSHVRFVLDGLDEDSPEHADALVVLDELRRAARIADQLLVVGTTTADDALALAPLDLSALAHEVAGRWGATSRRDIAVQAGGPLVALADATHLRHALDALVENALKACGPEDRITISTGADEGCAVLAVTDTGTGIAAHDLERIFERFERGTASAVGRGTGLGLAIVRAIAESHDGTVSVTSRLGRGSTFTLRLGPVLRAGEQPAQAHAAPDAAAQAA